MKKDIFLVPIQNRFDLIRFIYHRLFHGALWLSMELFPVFFSLCLMSSSFEPYFSTEGNPLPEPAEPLFQLKTA